MTFLAWATDPELRRNASSGGFTRALLVWMLETNVVDGVLVARTGPREGGFRPEAVVVEDPDELTDRRTASVYYPTAPLSVQLDPRKCYAATLLPCQVERLAAMQARGVRREISYVAELLCHSMPRPEWTQFLARRLTGFDDPQNVAYRGGAWPGRVTIDGESLPYLEAWRDQVGSMRGCPCSRTATSSAADWTVADPWNIPGPHGDGKTLVRIHSNCGRNLFGQLLAEGRIEAEALDEKVWQERMFKHAQRRQAK